MSNYSTSYNISQSGDLYTLQDHATTKGLAQYTSTRGTTVNAPINQRNLKLFRNFDNEYFFFVKNQDRKPVPLYGLQVHARIVDRERGNIIFSTKAIVIDPEMGSCKFLIRMGDTANMDEGYYDMVISYTDSFGLTKPLYIDMNMRPHFTLEVTDEGHAQPLATQVLTNWYQPSGDDYYYTQRIAGPAYYGKKGGLVTFGVYTTNYTGKFWMQGTTAEQPEEGDWFDLNLGMVTDYSQFVTFTGIDPFNFHSNLKYLRAKFEDNGVGSIDKVVVRV